MNKRQRPLWFALTVVAGLLVLGAVAYRVWFHNPHEDTLHLDAASIFDDAASSDGLLLRGATLIESLPEKPSSMRTCSFGGMPSLACS